MLPVNLVDSAVSASGPFDLISGLPVHPLVVHFAVVLLPLAALALIAIVFIPSWRKTFGWVVMAGLVVGTGAAFVAKESGEQLAERIGTPQEHAELGDFLPALAVLTLVVAGIWFWMQRREAKSAALTTTLGLAAAILALFVTGLTVVVGHTGAEAAWGGRLDTGSSAASETTNTATSGTTNDATSAAGAITAADVAKHNTASDCWTIVNGNVYDVTGWINKHPGGPAVIEAMCGKDGSSAFDGQHQGQGRPNSELADFQVGTLTAAGVGPAQDIRTTLMASRTPMAKKIKLTEVKKHNSATSCWSVVNGGVYDLTNWVNRHPGGASVIKAMCGKNASGMFNGEHGRKGREASVLAGFKIGTLG